MTPRQLRAALRTHFSDAGFVVDGSRFVRHTHELTHSVEITAVRRLPGTVQIDYYVCLKGQTQPLLSEELASHGHNSAYPRIWSAASVDGNLVLDQVLAIYRAFQTLHDVVHFFSDRFRRGDTIQLPGRPPLTVANSLSAAQASLVLQRLAREILNEGLSLVPRQADFELWADNQEVEDYRHCVYVEANYSSTLAVLVTFALPAQVIAGRLRSEREMRLLIAAPKHVLCAAGRPLLLPMTAPFDGHENARSALREYFALHPPHLLPRS